MATDATHSIHLLPVATVYNQTFSKIIHVYCSTISDWL